LRFAIVGTGAIGTYYGAKLAAGGQDVHFLVRSGLADLQRDGIQLNGPGEDLRLPRVNCYRSTDEIGPCDVALIAVKTTANSSLLDLIPPLLGKETALVTLQNGLGNEEFLAEHFGAERVLAGLCFICLRRIRPGQVIRYDHGHINIGEHLQPAGERARSLAGEFQRCGLKCGTVDNVALERWRKLVWNIPFNGLSIVAGGVDTAAIMANEELCTATTGLMREVVAAANRCGLSLDPEAVEEQIGRTRTMGNYKPSTLLDFEAGRPLEIEAIWGEPLRRARVAGTDTPRLQQLYSVLRSLDNSRQKQDR
jgi:2-dehydropantoate 2-reductase